MKGDPEFVILKYQAWMDASQFEDIILGAIVREPLSPTTNYIPDNPRHITIPEYQTGTATDFILEESGSTTDELALSSGKIGGLSVKGSRSDSVHLAGKLIRYKRIRQLDRYWVKLSQDPEVQSIAASWISLFNTWPVCLVVGIMICEDVELAMDGASSREVKGRIELPLGQIALPATAGSKALGMEAGLEAGKQTASIFKAKMGKSNIFAVELRKVTTDTFRRKQLRLKNTGPDIDETRLAGMDESDDDYEDRPRPGEQLVLDDLGDDDYRDLVE